MDYFYGVCMLFKLGAYSGQCQREGKAHSDLGLGPLGIQTPGSKWHQVSPIQTTPQTNANSGPNSRAFLSLRDCPGNVSPLPSPRDALPGLTFCKQVGTSRPWACPGRVT